MKKFFNKAVLNGATVMGDGLTYPRIPNVYTGDNEGGYQRGDMMDANAVVEMIKELTDTGEITIDELQNLINEEIQERVEGDQDQQRYTDQKIKDLIGTSPETLDTLKEIADALGEDPDFAANVWNKIAELTTKHNEDVQELQDAITSGFENIDFTPYVKKTDVVTDTTNGLMLASDKVKLDAFEEAEQYTKAVNLPDSVISNADMSSDANSVILRCTKTNLIDGSSNEFNMIIPAVTEWNAGVVPEKYSRKIEHLTDRFIGHNGIKDLLKLSYASDSISLNYSLTDIYTGEERVVIKIDEAKPYQAGVMSASDWIKLQSLKNYQAGNGIDITGDTISCTLDTSLYSIVTELPETGLPNKIYLLPSTKTEEGNIYTEYGYVDNKWEEIGKYKSDVDLSPYERALNLPSDVIKTLGVQSGANYVNVYSYKEDLDRGILSEVSEFDIPIATSEKAGIITAQDKAKLDGIEAGAQVNKIESISVNGTSIDPVDKHINLPEVSRTSAGILPAAGNNLNGTTIPYFLDYYSHGENIKTSIKWGSVYFKVPNKESYFNYCAINLIIGDNDTNYSLPPQIRIIGNSHEGISVDKENDQAIKIKTKISSDSRNILRILDDGLFVDKTLPNKQDALTEVQLNNINNAITSISINNIEQVNTNGAVNLTIPNASITEHGLMSKEDKAKLDSQPTIKANNATGVTDDDYVVIKKSEYQSILDRLSALENKA